MDDRKVVESPSFYENMAQIKNFIDGDLHRSLIFYGLSGFGKSRIILNTPLSIREKLLEIYPSFLPKLRDDLLILGRTLTQCDPLNLHLRSCKNLSDYANALDNAKVKQIIYVKGAENFVMKHRSLLELLIKLSRSTRHLKLIFTANTMSDMLTIQNVLRELTFPLNCKMIYYDRSEAEFIQFALVLSRNLGFGDINSLLLSSLKQYHKQIHVSIRQLKRILLHHHFGKPLTMELSSEFKLSHLNSSEIRCLRQLAKDQINSKKTSFTPENLCLAANIHLSNSLEICSKFGSLGLIRFKPPLSLHTALETCIFHDEVEEYQRIADSTHVE